MRRVIHCSFWILIALAMLPAAWAVGQSEKQSTESQTPAPAASPAPETAPPQPDGPSQPDKPAEAPSEPAKADEQPAQTDAAKAESKKAEADKDAKPEPATHTVKVSPFKISITLRGTFEASAMSDISVRLAEWKSLEVVSAVAHGTAVKKGDLLVQFDTEDIDQAIGDLRMDLQLGALQLKQADANLRILEATTPLDLAAAERSKRVAEEDLARFLVTERPLSEKLEDFVLKMNQNSLEYQEEELRQLEKMYKADDLTEETEEIILKRQRDAVERAKFSVELAKMLHSRAMKVQLPREEESRKELARREKIDLDRAQVSLPRILEQQKIECEKLKIHQDRNQRRLKKLLADRDAMKVVAPVDGIVYYGQFARGDWSGASSAAENLRPGGTINPRRVFMTVIETRPMVIRASVSEKDLHWMQAGLQGIVEATGYPNMKLEATLSQIDALPTIDGRFEAVFRIDLDKAAEALVPEMTCTVKLTPYLNKEALTIPSGSLFTEELDDRQSYVYVLKDGKPQKQTVTAGKKSDDRVEILQGLQAGDRVLLEKPKEDAPAK